MGADYDLCVIGGGINGAGIARDAAGRGLSVFLVEARDLASATSSASSKMIHGGLRYLEQYEFGLVRTALKEREVLLRAAPHIVRPVDFVLPHMPGLRPAWLVRAGLFLYDHIGGRKKLSVSRGLALAKYPAVAGPLKRSYKKAFMYSDCWVDDARLVVLNAMDARERGADILPHTACVGLAYQDHAAPSWLLSLQNTKSGDRFQVSARMVVNAAGPWVRGILEASGLTGDPSCHVPQVRLVKGSHIVVPKLYDGAQAYLFQQPDRRVVFVLPFEQDFTLIGTTDVDFTGDPTHVTIDDHEVEYLCKAANLFFKRMLRPQDIVWAYSGVRPLIDDGAGAASNVTRDYELFLDPRFDAPLLSVFGGKITTYRRLAEQALNRLLKETGRGRPQRKGEKAPWTQDACLPGGDMPEADFTSFLAGAAEEYGWLPEDLLLRYAGSYGTLMAHILDGAQSLLDLGEHYGDGVYEAELRYLLRAEFVSDLEDVLWRRSKLGLHISAHTAQAMARALPKLAAELAETQLKFPRENMPSEPRPEPEPEPELELEPGLGLKQKQEQEQEQEQNRGMRDE